MFGSPARLLLPTSGTRAAWELAPPHNRCFPCLRCEG